MTRVTLRERHETGVTAPAAAENNVLERALTANYDSLIDVLDFKSR